MPNRENTTRTALKKPELPDNQQERLNELAHWIRGFVDGEGCFGVSFIAQPDIIDPSRPFGRRKSYKTGYQVGHYFSVVQGERSKKCLKLIMNFFNVGKIYINRRHDNHKENLWHYCVTRRDDLLKVIIPFFETNPLLSAKQADFEIFAEIVGMTSRKEHKSFDGLIKIAKMTEKMNHKKSREKLIRILRDHTSGSQSVSTKKLLAKDMVPSA